MTIDCNVAVIGGGLAGLLCALELESAGVEVKLFEASDALGGRVRTDAVDGFLLDRGFQVLLTAYPECRRILDYDELRMRPFQPGSLVFTEGRMHRVADPWRRPQHLLATLRAPVGSWTDKLRIRRLRFRACRGKLAHVFRRHETTALEALRRTGFSERMIDRFFRPWMGGVFLGRELGVSSRMLDFVFRMMSTGETAIPEGGMQAIPEYLARLLRHGTARTGWRAEQICDGNVRFANGETVRAERVVLAVEGPAAARLVGGAIPEPGSRGVTCLYYTAPATPVRGGWLALDGEGSGPVNNLAVPSQVSPSYSPPGRQLICATVLEDAGSGAELDRAARKQLRRWFGGMVEEWELIREYRIPHAQPAQEPGFMERARSVPVEPLPGVFLAGDYRENASINGAMASGRKAARGVLTSLRGDAGGTEGAG